MKQNLELYYDEEADVLEVFLGEPTPSYFEEIEDDVFEGKDKRTNELKGFKIFNFRKRGGIKNVKISLPANIKIEGVC